MTFFTTPSFYDRIKTELLRNFDTDTPHLVGRIRYVIPQSTDAYSGLTVE